ncbi:UNVERIFIED_CONTAM: hypothetical protein GTU68_007812 [Idotea baltica]|nr:hypothetical protein [Idotea baltica]
MSPWRRASWSSADGRSTTRPVSTCIAASRPASSSGRLSWPRGSRSSEPT